jgi:hypothetical protein
MIDYLMFKNSQLLNMIKPRQGIFLSIHESVFRLTRMASDSFRRTATTRDLAHISGYSQRRVQTVIADLPSMEELKVHPRSILLTGDQSQSR